MAAPGCSRRHCSLSLIDVNVPGDGSQHDRAMADDPRQKAQELVDRLRARGHTAEAEKLAHHLSVQKVERGLLTALRETLEVLLTAIEAIDPVTQTMIEELRVEVEKRLRLPAREGGKA